VTRCCIQEPRMIQRKGTHGEGALELLRELVEAAVHVVEAPLALVRQRLDPRRPVLPLLRQADTTHQRVGSTGVRERTPPKPKYC
jgi:hypothetical protein